MIMTSKPAQPAQINRFGTFYRIFLVLKNIFTIRHNFMPEKVTVFYDFLTFPRRDEWHSSPVRRLLFGVSCLASPVRHASLFRTVQDVSHSSDLRDFSRRVPHVSTSHHQINISKSTHH